jgi:ferredoxin-type protein NapH
MTAHDTPLPAPPTSYTRWRLVVRTTFLLALLAIPLRVLGFDHRTGQFFFLHWGIPLQKLYLPFLALLAIFVVLMVISIKRGRIFCSWLCPMHTLLEWTNSGARPRQARRWWLGLLFATVGTEVVISFFLALPDQIAILRTSPRWPLLAGAMGAIWLGLLALFLYYREGFCQQACPYALVQLLLQSEDTRLMQFRDPERRCIHCNACDHSCPQNLKARMECNLRHCTNCYRCAEACHCVLGQHRGLFKLDAPESNQGSTHDD